MTADAAPGRRIYVASSWRNNAQPAVVKTLREAGHYVYDFRNPRPGDDGFHWSEIDPDWLAWRPGPFRDALAHPVAQAGFASDFDAMRWADAFVLVLPCGRSAHLEAGWAIGAGKPTAILLHEDGFEPELMYLLADRIAVDMAEVVGWLAALPAPGRRDEDVETVRTAVFASLDCTGRVPGFTHDDYDAAMVSLNRLADRLAAAEADRDHYKREFEERLRVNVGLLAENTELKKRLAVRGETQPPVTVIDADEFEAAHDDPQWRSFCEKADRYIEDTETQP